MYCQYCGTQLAEGANFCPNCGASTSATNHNTGATAQNTQQWSDTAKTAGTVAGAVVGASVLSRLLRRRRYHHPRPPMGGPHHGPRGPMGGRPHGHMGGGPHGPGGHR